MTPQERYDAMIAAGESPMMAEMLALQCPPGIGGGAERTFFEGRGANPMAGMPEWQARGALAMAKKAGIVTAGKIYKPSLADKRGPADPLAWVSDLHDVKRVCELRNYEARGAVRHTARELPPVEAPRLAPDIVDDFVQQEIAKEPLKKHNIGELREKVIEKHGRPK